MRLFVILFLLSGYVHAGELVDADNDGLYCVMEDDNKYCGEDDQDKCDFIPNVSRDDDHCEIDFNNDDKFTIADVMMMLAQNDHRLTGTVYPNYVEVGVPWNFGGFICFDSKKVIKYNNDLFAAGLQLLQLALPVIVVSEGVHCGLDHHSYPPIL